jgi:hypothetical protein
MLLGVLCMAITGLFLFSPYGRLIGTYARFFRLQSEYEAVVQRMDPTKPATLERQDSDPSFEIDEGPPLRVAFSWGGIIDNWYGIVYDPTGEVMRANEFKSDWSNWGDPKLKQVKRLFGGDLLHARKLKPSWYFCSFT